MNDRRKAEGVKHLRKDLRRAGDHGSRLIRDRTRKDVELGVYFVTTFRGIHSRDLIKASNAGYERSVTVQC